MNYAEIETFLKSKGYHKDMHYECLCVTDGQDIIDEFYGDTWGDCLRQALDHWLSRELGRNWDTIIDAIDYASHQRGLVIGISIEEMKSIKKAIAWHKALESEAE